MTSAAQTLANWATVAALFIAAGGLIFSAIQLLRGVKEARRSTLERVTGRTENIHLKMLDDPELVPLLTRAVSNDLNEKQALFLNIIINHYAYVFDLFGPEKMPKEFENDIREFFSWDVAYSRLESLSTYHSPQFLEYICSLTCTDVAAQRE